MKRLFPLALCACTALAHAQTLEETIQLALAYQAQQAVQKALFGPLPEAEQIAARPAFAA